MQRRAKPTDIIARVGNHTFRATGVTTCLKNGGMPERAAQMANHASARAAIKGLARLLVFQHQSGHSKPSVRIAHDSQTWAARVGPFAQGFADRWRATRL
jgi:integrase